MSKFNILSRTTVALVAVGALASVACAAQPPARSESARLGCEQLGDGARADYLAPGKVSGVRRVTETQHVARAVQVERTVGAELLVQAEPGVTPDYLQRVLSCQAESGAASASVLRSSEGSVAITVRSDAGRLAVRAIGSNNAAGEQIWQQAQSLTSSGASVEQVASLGGSAY